MKSSTRCIAWRRHMVSIDSRMYAVIVISQSSLQCRLHATAGSHDISTLINHDGWAWKSGWEDESLPRYNCIFSVCLTCYLTALASMIELIHSRSMGRRSRMMSYTQTVVPYVVHSRSVQVDGADAACTPTVFSTENFEADQSHQNENMTVVVRGFQRFPNWCIKLKLRPEYLRCRGCKGWGDPIW